MSAICKFVTIFLCLSHFLAAQDIYFVQLENAPLTINPAEIGNFSGKYRINFNYQNKTSEIPRGDAYEYYALSIDSKLRLSEKRHLGIGISSQIDKAGHIQYGNDQYKIGASLIQYLSDASNPICHSLTFGFDIGISNRIINTDGDRWSAQRDDNGGNNPIIIVDDLIAGPILHNDIAVGMMWQSVFHQKHTLKIGIGINHFNTPQISFLGQENQLRRRFNWHASGEITLSSKTSLLPSILFIEQGPHNLFALGSAFKIYPNSANKNKSIQLGYWYKSGEINKGTIGLLTRFNSFNLGLSYDMAINERQSKSINENAIQVTLGYIIR